MVVLLANNLLLLRRIVSPEVLLDAKYSLVQGSTGGVPPPYISS